MIEDRLFEKILIEGNFPERALSRLQKSGIALYKVKKIKKNQILATVSKKDSRKVFAIYPQMCYNREDKKAYSVQKAGKIGLYKRLDFLCRRWGVILGVATFLFFTSLSELFVFSILVTGETSYAREAEEILSSFGVKKGKPYPKGREEKIATALLSLQGVTFATVQKSGVTVKVELQTSPFMDAEQAQGDMKANHTGVLLSATVLRGTLLKNIGQTVQKGEPVVGGYILTGENAKTDVAPSAKIVLLCTFEETYPVENEDTAFEKALLYIDGTIKEKQAEKTETGVRVKIVYEVTESINF